MRIAFSEMEECSITFNFGWQGYGGALEAKLAMASAILFSDLGTCATSFELLVLELGLSIKPSYRSLLRTHLGSVMRLLASHIETLSSRSRGCELPVALIRQPRTWLRYSRSRTRTSLLRISISLLENVIPCQLRPLLFWKIRQF